MKQPEINYWITAMLNRHDRVSDLNITVGKTLQVESDGVLVPADATPEQSAEWRGRMVERVAGKLDLNAEQKAKLTVLSDKLHAQRLAVRGSTDPRAEVQSLVAGATFDRAKAQALVQQKTDAVRTGSPEVIAAMGDFYDSLNPAQQQQVRDFMQKRRGWRRGG